MNRVFIINPIRLSLLKRDSKQSTSKKGKHNMVKRRKVKRSRASYVRAGKKAARAKKRRKNPKYTPGLGRRHRPVVYSTGKGADQRLRRSPWYILSPRRVNPKRRKRRRNPVNFKSITQKYFGKESMTNAIMLLIGLGGSGALKGMTVKFLPEGAAKDWYQRLYGILSIVIGATLTMKGRRAELKSIGTGMVVFGLYDVIVTNITGLQAYLPSISAPSAFAGDYRDYGTSTYLGSGIQPGSVEVVGSNITSGEMPEIIGDDMDLADMLDMAA